MYNVAICYNYKPKAAAYTNYNTTNYLLHSFKLIFKLRNIQTKFKLMQKSSVK